MVKYLTQVKNSKPNTYWWSEYVNTSYLDYYYVKIN